MADSIGVIVSGDRKVSLRFEQFPDQFHDRLLSRITKLTDTLEGTVKQLAPIRTGRLESEVYGKVFDDPNRITGYVAVGGDSKADFEKAGALEYGAKSKITVSSHQMALDHNWAEKLKSPTMVLVASYQRQLNVPAFHFLSRSLQVQTAFIESGLQEAVTETIDESEP